VDRKPAVRLIDFYEGCVMRRGDWHDLGISEKSENRTLEKLMMEDSGPL
jgi:hypothetical protein